MSDRAGYRWIDEQQDLDDLVEATAGDRRYAIDTEFHRERTYFPALALLQIAREDGDLALVDPLAVDVTSFRRLFESDAEAVFHAAQQDLDVLTHAVGAVPRRMFDTQIAGGFLGYGTPSLVSILSGELGVSPAKGDRLTDWLRRPLTEAQRTYAAADVSHLLELQDRLTEQLAGLGRLGWVADACEELRTRPTGPVDPDDAWLRLKDTSGLRPQPRAVARAVAAWRERTAMERDVPVRQVLPDLAVLGIAQRLPSSDRELAQARGVDERFSRGRTAQQILEAVAAGRRADPPPARSNGDDLERELRPAVTLVSAWVSQLAKTERIDTALLATRADLVAFLAGDPESRLSKGWRAELLGDGIRDLLSGRAALTFDRGRGLRLVDLGDVDESLNT